MTKRCISEFADYAETKSATSDGNLQWRSNAATFEKLEVDAERGVITRNGVPIRMRNGAPLRRAALSAGKYP